jgi:threonine aldolase
MRSADSVLLRSDNVAGVSPEIMTALAEANAGEAIPYGEDPLSAALPAQFSALFGTKVMVQPVVSGTAANALAIACIAGPHALVYCHEEAHCLHNEGGSVEFFSPGCRLQPVPGRQGKIDPDALLEALSHPAATRGDLFIPAGLTLTQLTEAGTAYSVEELARLCDIAKRFGLHVHMDGARLANAAASLKCGLADFTWKAGVDVLSFGGTKNGTLCADAVVVFNPALSLNFKRRLKRAGHDLSKARFLAAQLSRYIQDGLWLRNAARANAAAREAAEILLGAPGAELLHPVEGNMIFIALPVSVVERLSARGAALRPAAGSTGGKQVFRLVTSFETGSRFMHDLRSLLVA